MEKKKVTSVEFLEFIGLFVGTEGLIFIAKLLGFLPQPTSAYTQYTILLTSILMMSYFAIMRIKKWQPKNNFIFFIVSFVLCAILLGLTTYYSKYMYSLKSWDSDLVIVIPDKLNEKWQEVTIQQAMEKIESLQKEAQILREKANTLKQENFEKNKVQIKLYNDNALILDSKVRPYQTFVNYNGDYLKMIKDRGPELIEEFTSSKDSLRTLIYYLLLYCFGGFFLFTTMFHLFLLVRMQDNTDEEKLENEKAKVVKGDVKIMSSIQEGKLKITIQTTSADEMRKVDRVLAINKDTSAQGTEMRLTSAQDKERVYIQDLKPGWYKAQVLNSISEVLKDQGNYRIEVDNEETDTIIL